MTLDRYGRAKVVGLLLASTLTLAGGLGAQPTVVDEPLSLSEAMERARQAAREVQAARARASASQADVERARGARLPTLKLEETWVYTDAPADVFGLQLQQERFSFPDFVASDPNDPGFFDSSTTRLEISAPLYTGGEISARIRQAELAAEAASRNAHWTADGAALEAATAWIRLAQARERVALLERSLETVEAHAELARKYEDQGMLVASERLRAEVERARVEDLLTEAQGQARVADANLSFRLVAEPDGSWELEPLPEPEPLARDLDTWLAGADDRADLEAAENQVAAAELEERVARAARLPRVGISARHDLVDEWPAGTHGDSTGIFAQASVDLWAGGRHKAAQAAARARADAARTEVEQALEGAKLQIRNAYEAARTSYERWQTAIASLEAARENERILGERFRKGIVKTLDVLDAATALREAETRELVSRAEAWRAGFELARVAGMSPEERIDSTYSTRRPTP